jgi:hypothetical protein
LTRSATPRLSTAMVALAAAVALLLGPLAGSGTARPKDPNPNADKGMAQAGFLAPEEPVTEEPVAEPRVVVADIDTGINPYHEFFYTGAESSVTPAVLAEFGIDESHIIRLTRTGDFAADYAADAEQWAAVQEGEPYWFEGTNIIGISFDPGSRIIMPDNENDTHGVGTAASILTANPEAVVVFVEGMADADAEAWAFNHPAIDAVSTSYGFPGSLPIPFHIENSYVGVVENGKHHFGAADNSPALSPPDGTSGPWWTIGIAGFEEHTSEGRQVLSGTLPDFVADFTQDLPYCAECESGTRSVGGTSFATPLSAGTFSKVLLEARRAAGHVGGIVTEGVDAPLMVDGAFQLTNWEIRRALEEGAYYPTTADWDPIEGVFDFLSVPVNDVAPWTQVSWGAITPDEQHEVVTQTLAHLGIGDAPTRTKSADTCAGMTANIEARHLYWDWVAFGSESYGTDADPYIYC